jgi:hemoglobin
MHSVSPPVVSAPHDVTLYERLTKFARSDGVFTAVTAGLYNRILGPVGYPELGDPALASYFVGIDRERLERHMTGFLIHATGGPRQYSGRAMDRAHASLGVTHEAFDRVIAHVVDTLREHQVPEEWIAEVGAVVEPLRPAIVGPPNH